MESKSHMATTRTRTRTRTGTGTGTGSTRRAQTQKHWLDPLETRVDVNFFVNDLDTIRPKHASSLLKHTHKRVRMWYGMLNLYTVMYHLMVFLQCTVLCCTVGFCKFALDFGYGRTLYHTLDVI